MINSSAQLKTSSGEIMKKTLLIPIPFPSPQLFHQLASFFSHLDKRPKPRYSSKKSSRYIYLHGTQLWWFFKQGCLPSPLCNLCSMHKQTMFHPLASAETSPIPVSDCGHHEPSPILQQLFWLLDCNFLGAKKIFFASSASSTVRILGYSQCSKDVTHRHLTGKERDMWSHISMSCTFEFQSIGNSLEDFLSCSRGVSPDVTQVNLHDWWCEQQSHYQIMCIDGWPMKCSGKRERSQNQRDLVEVQVIV